MCWCDNILSARRKELPNGPTSDVADKQSWLEYSTNLSLPLPLFLLIAEAFSGQNVPKCLQKKGRQIAQQQGLDQKWSCECW